MMRTPATLISGFGRFAPATLVAFLFILTPAAGMADRGPTLAACVSAHPAECHPKKTKKARKKRRKVKKNRSARALAQPMLGCAGIRDSEERRKCVLGMRKADSGDILVAGLVVNGTPLGAVLGVGADGKPKAGTAKGQGGVIRFTDGREVTLPGTTGTPLDVHFSTTIGERGQRTTVFNARPEAKPLERVAYSAAALGLEAPRQPPKPVEPVDHGMHRGVGALLGGVIGGAVAGVPAYFIANEAFTETQVETTANGEEGNFLETEREVTNGKAVGWTTGAAIATGAVIGAVVGWNAADDRVFPTQTAGFGTTEKGGPMAFFSGTF